MTQMMTNKWKYKCGAESYFKVEKAGSRRKSKLLFGPGRGFQCISDESDSSQSQNKKAVVFSYSRKGRRKNDETYSISKQRRVSKKRDSSRQKETRRSRNDPLGRDFLCGCGKKYLSYPALYTHIRQKHDGVEIEGTQKTLEGANRRRGRPKKFPVDDIYNLPSSLEGSQEDKVLHEEEDVYDEDSDGEELFEDDDDNCYDNSEQSSSLQDIFRNDQRSKSTQEKPQNLSPKTKSVEVSQNHQKPRNVQDLYVHPKPVPFKRLFLLPFNKSQMEVFDEYSGLTKGTCNPFQTIKFPKFLEYLKSVRSIDTRQVRGLLCIDQAFAVFLYNLSGQCKPSFLQTVEQVLLCLRSCLNKNYPSICHNLFSTRRLKIDFSFKLKDQRKQYSESSSCEYVPLICQYFVSQYAYQNMTDPIDKQLLVSIIYDLCSWMNTYRMCKFKVYRSIQRRAENEFVEKQAEEDIYYD